MKSRKRPIAETIEAVHLQELLTKSFLPQSLCIKNSLDPTVNHLQFYGLEDFIYEYYCKCDHEVYTFTKELL